MSLPNHVFVQVIHDLAGGQQVIEAKFGRAGLLG
jgi:hypothetical protein